MSIVNTADQLNNYNQLFDNPQIQPELSDVIKPLTIDQIQNIINDTPINQINNLVTRSVQLELKSNDINLQNNTIIVPSINSTFMPVPDTYNAGIKQVITPALTLDNTSEILMVNNRQVIDNIPTIPIGFDGYNDTVRSIDFDQQMGRYGPQREAIIKPLRYGTSDKKDEVIVTKDTCKFITAKNTQCKRKPKAGCKYCGQHYAKKLESGVISEEEEDEDQKLDDEVEKNISLEGQNKNIIENEEDEQIEEEIEDTEDLGEEFESNEESEIPENEIKPKKKAYKKVMKIIPKTMKIKQFKELSKTINLGYSKILPVKKPKIIALPPNTVKDELTKLPTENDQMFEYRKEYTIFVFKHSDGNIPMKSCISIGKMKLYKLIYGVTYDPEMEDLITNIDSIFKK
jgi:hypothetical protein